MKTNIPKMLMTSIVRAIPVAILAAILLSILGTALVVIESVFLGIGTVVATLVMGIVAFLLFVMAKEIHSGKENLVDMIPVMILVVTLGGVFASYIPALAVILEINTLTAIAMSLVVVYLAEEISRKYIKL